MDNTFDDKQHIKLTTNSRALKIRVVGFILLMGFSVYISFHIIYLSMIYCNYKEALIKTMEFKINAADFHNLTGAVKLTMHNYFGIPVHIKRITGFFVFNENVPKTASSPYIEKRRIFGSGSAVVNKTLGKGEVNLDVEGVLNFADVGALGHVLQGMSLVNLKNPLEYHIFIDASISIFNHKFEIVAPFIKVKPFVYSPLIILKRLYLMKQNIMAFDDSNLSKKDKEKIAKINKVKEVYFLEDLIEHFNGGVSSNIKNAAWHVWQTKGLSKLLVKVLLIFKFYHIHVTIPNLKVSADLYFENDFLWFNDNSALTKYNVLKEYTPRDSVSVEVEMLQIQGIKNTEADAFTTKSEFNNKFLSVIQINKKVSDFLGIIWHMAFQTILKGTKTVPTLTVGVDRKVNKFNSNFDYNNIIVERMGTLSFYLLPLNDEGIERNKKYIKTQDEYEWFDNYEDL